MDLRDEILEFAHAVNAERDTLHATIALLKLGEQSETNDRIRESIRDDGQLRLRRVAQLKTFADRAPATIRGRLYAIAIDLADGKPVMVQLCEVAGGIEDAAAVYRGDGQIEIDGQQHFITAQNDQQFIETLLANGGAALTKKLTTAGVSNPSVTAKNLTEWKDGVLAPYIETPNGVKGAGYRTTIVDARK